MSMCCICFCLLFLVCPRDATIDSDTSLTIPRVSGELTTPDQLHKALAPAWDSLVEGRNNAGLVDPKEEGKPSPPLSKEETAFQYDRVQKGNVDSARLLLVFGMVPSARHIDNETLQSFLLDKKGEFSENDGSTSLTVISPDLKYPDGSTPLHMASAFGLEKSVQSLLDARADISATALSGIQPIHAAAIMGHTSVVETLCERSADPNARHSFAGSTPLHFAAEMGHHNVVQRLCELGADVEAEKSQGGTAIHISADTNNSQVTRMLIEKCGADPDAVLLGDTVPLYLAAGRGFPQVIDVLLEAGADADRTLWPRRPLQDKHKRRKKVISPHGGALQASTDSSQFLPGSHPNAPGFERGNGATALHNACENGHASAAEALLDGGARQLATMQGVTPLLTSLQYKHPRIASILLDHRTPANVAVTNPGDGQSALHVAAAYDYPEIIVRILRCGGETLVRDRRGYLAMDYCRDHLCRFILSRFHGRVSKLDSIIRSHKDGEDLVHDLLNVDEVEAKASKMYVKYARYHIAGTLAARAQTFAERLKRGDLPKDEHDLNLQRFAISRFILAGSDSPVAVECMMQKTQASMQAGLILLGVKVKTLEYMPGKSLILNGHEVHSLVNDMVKAALQSQETQDSTSFESRLIELRSIAENGGEKASSENAVDSSALRLGKTIKDGDEEDNEGDTFYGHELEL